MDTTIQSTKQLKKIAKLKKRIKEFSKEVKK